MGYLTITDLGLGHLTWEEVEPWCSLDGLKRHLIVEHDVDDELIKEYAVASWNLVETTIERSVKGLFEQYDGIMPPTLIHAVRLLVGRYYAEREGESFTNRRDMSFSISALLMPYKGIPQFKADEPSPEPQPQPQPEPKYTYVELAKYQDVADFLGCRICDLTETEKKWLVSTDFALAARIDGTDRLQNYMENYSREIPKYYGEYADKVIAVARNRAKVFPLFDQSQSFCGLALFSPFVSVTHDLKDVDLDIVSVFLDLGASHDKMVGDMLDKLIRGEYASEERVKLFTEKVLTPLHRYFEALCKFEPKKMEIYASDERLDEFTQPSGVIYNGSLVQLMIYNNILFGNLRMY